MGAYSDYVLKRTMALIKNETSKNNKKCLPNNRRFPFKVSSKIDYKNPCFSLVQICSQTGAYLELGAFKKFFPQDWAIIRAGRLIENLL